MKHKIEPSEELWKFVQGLSADELKSVLKSNRFGWNARKKLKHTLFWKKVGELSATTECVVVGDVLICMVLNDIHKSQNKTKTRKK